jgi:hypothetical protein
MVRHIIIVAWSLLIHTVPHLRRPLFGGVSLVELFTNNIWKIFFLNLIISKSLLDSRWLAVSVYVIISARFIPLQRETLVIHLIKRAGLKLRISFTFVLRISGHRHNCLRYVLLWLFALHLLHFIKSQEYVLSVLKQVVVMILVHRSVTTFSPLTSLSFQKQFILVLFLLGDASLHKSFGIANRSAIACRTLTACNFC